MLCATLSAPPAKDMHGARGASVLLLHVCVVHQSRASCEVTILSGVFTWFYCARVHKVHALACSMQRRRRRLQRAQLEAHYGRPRRRRSVVVIAVIMQKFRESKHATGWTRASGGGAQSTDHFNLAFCVLFFSKHNSCNVYLQWRRLHNFYVCIYM